jgi:DNA-binding NtrC family response regulator
MAKSYSILIVEDDPVMRAMVGMLLETAGHRAVGIAGAQGASEILKLEPFDLIVTDVVMPKMDGLEFIQEVRQKWPTLPIIAISGGGDHLAGTYCLKTASSLGASATLAKPFDNQVFLDTVERVMSSKSQLVK